MDLDLFESLVLIVHVVAAVAVIGLVLIQHGKGSDMGAGFGSGASGTCLLYTSPSPRDRG